MLGKWYKITGFTKELIESWKNDLREDVIILTEGNYASLRIRLNWLQAIRMKRAIRNFNVHNPILLQLKKVDDSEL